MAGLNLAQRVSTDRALHLADALPGELRSAPAEQPGEPYRVVAIDFGIKRAILERLAAHGCAVTVLPADASLDQVLAHNPEGVFLSNGPGDPAAVTSGIELARALLHRPICRCSASASVTRSWAWRWAAAPTSSATATAASTIPAAARGGGDHQPEPRLCHRRHSLPSDAVEVTHFNLNDRTVAALAHRHKPVFGVQYHPEASPGPHDADHHFGRFAALMAARRWHQCSFVAVLSVAKTVTTLQAPQTSEVRSHH